MFQGIGNDHRLFGNFLGHEMLVAGLFDPGLVHLHAGFGAVGQAVLIVEDLRAGPGDDGPVAFLQIGDAVGHRGQGDGIRAHEHLARAMADGERRAFAGGDHQVILAVEQETQREGPVQAFQRGAGGFHRAGAAVDLAFGQKGNGFGVGVGFLSVAVGGQFGAEVAKVFDDAVMDHGDLACPVRVGVGHCGGAMRGPAGVADPGLSREGVVDQKVRQIDQLADGTAAVQPPGVHRGDPGAVVAAIFQPLQRLDQQGCCFMVPKDPDNTAHYDCPFALAALMAFNLSNIRVARPGLVTCRARPMATASAGTSSVITDPLAVSAPSPTVTGATSMVSDPMKARLPITVRCFITPS